MASVTYGWSYDRPFIPVVISNPVTPQNRLIISALVDTGSDNCLFPGSLAIALGFDLKTGKLDSSSGIGNTKIPSWQHNCILELLSPNKKTIVKKLPVSLIAFSDNTDECNVVPPLLGTSNFFNHFKMLQVAYKNKATMLIY